MADAFLKGYRLISILSIDIVIGAIISALFFGDILNIQILPYGLAALGLTVWIIYTSDHLIDARRIEGSASSTRHRFHQTNSKPLLICVLVACALDAVMIFFIRQQVFVWGVVLAASTLVYFLVQTFLRYLKELVVAVIYTTGVMLPSIAVRGLQMHGNQVWIVIGFASIAFVNLLIFSWFDIDSDSKDGQSSFATFFGRHVTARVIWIMLSCIFIISLIVMNVDLKAGAILMAMNTFLTIVFSFRKRLNDTDYFRIIADSVFFLPIVYVIWRE